MPVISLKVPERQIKRIKAFTEEEGYTSQSEFIRDAIRRRMEFVLLSKGDIKAIEEGKKDIKEGKVYSPEEVRKELDVE